MTPLDIAIHRTFHGWPGGIKAAAAALGIRSEQVMRNKACATTKQNMLGLHEARDAMLMSGDLQILQALAAELGGRLEMNHHEHGDLMQELLREQAEHGDVARAVTQAISDGRVTQREVADVRREALEEIQALNRIVESLQAAADANVPLFKAV